MAKESIEFKSAQDFLNNRQRFQLGHLSTESFHPLTQNFSYECQNNLFQAIASLKAVDEKMLQALPEHFEVLFGLSEDVRHCLKRGGKIILCGCGATGRLSLALEAIFRLEQQDIDLPLISFMAGGDYALIKSVESFEDSREYARRQLEQIEPQAKDLFIGITEGGETTFVLEGVRSSLDFITENPWLIYCNPDHELANIARSQELIQDPKVKNYSLFVGPMAISGSTRMQASTAQMIFVGFALYGAFHQLSRDQLQMEFLKSLEYFQRLDYQKLQPYIEKEAQAYLQGESFYYQSDQQCGLSVLTDTTERSPTFNLKAFENSKQQNTDHSWVYMGLGEHLSIEKAWFKLLGNRSPRTLEWSDIDKKISLEDLYGFDINHTSFERRKSSNSSFQHLLKIYTCDKKLNFDLQNIECSFEAGSESILVQQICLKLLLNTLSTTVMGLVGRVEGNMMSWVVPSNGKLIDRAIRYADHLLSRKGIYISYIDLAKKLFELKELRLEEGIVTKLVQEFLEESSSFSSS